VTLEIEKTEWIGKSYIKNLSGLFQEHIMRWRCLVDKRRCFFANLGSDIRESRDSLRQRSCMSNLTGSLQKISATRSNGRVGSGSSCSDVRVLLEVVVNCCVMVAFVSSVTGREETELF
jgi:hypothetical protein